VNEVVAAIVSGAFVFLAMQARKNSELKVEIFTRLNKLEQITARLEERCPMKNTR
tara:strand:+ start:2054 stop:2218 length:165 start_codon:yes stop_codon:yes gene_type:complete